MSSKRRAIDLVSLLFLLSSISKSLLIKYIYVLKVNIKHDESGMPKHQKWLFNTTKSPHQANQYSNCKTNI